MTSRQGSSPQQRIEYALLEYVRTGATDAVSDPGLTADAEHLLREASSAPPRSPAREQALLLAGRLHLSRTAAFKAHLGLPDLTTTVLILGLSHDTRASVLPALLWELVVEFGADPDSRARSALTLLDSARSEGVDTFSALIALHHALSDMTDDHPNLTAYQALAAVRWVERHRLTGGDKDLDNAVEYGRSALSRSTGHGTGRADILAVLCEALTRRLALDPTPENLRYAVETCRKTLAVTPAGDTAHFTGQISLGGCLSARFDHSRELADLDEAVALLRQGVADARTAGALRADQMESLAQVLHKRYRQAGAPADLDETIQVLEAVAWSDRARAAPLEPDIRALHQERAAGPGTPPLRRPAPRTPHSRAEEARLLIQRDETRDDPIARDRGIELMGPALWELPEDFPDRAPCLAILGSALLRRHRFGGLDPADLESADELMREAVRLCPRGDANEVVFRRLLIMAAQAQYERTGAWEDLEAVIGMHRTVLTLAMPVTEHRQQALYGLGVLVSERFARTGSLSDLDEAVDALRQCLELTGPADEGYGPTALHFASLLLRRAEHTDARRDLDEAHACLRAVQPHLPPQDPRRDQVTELLVAVGDRLAEHRTRDEEHITPSLRRLTYVSGPGDRPAIAPEDAGHDSHAVGQYGNILAEHLQRHGRTGDPAELETGLDIGRRLLAGMPANLPERPRFSGHFGALLFRRFEHHGDHRDLDAAIEHISLAAYGPHSVVQHLRNELDWPDATVEQLSRAVRGGLDGALSLGSDRGDELSLLAAAHVRRFERDGARGDLDEAVHAARRATEGTPRDDEVALSDRMLTLGTTLVLRHQATGSRADLDRAVALGREVMTLIGGYAWNDAKLTALGGLCNRLRARYLLTGDAADLDEAIACGRAAVVLIPGTHSDHAARTNLALALGERAALRSDAADRAEAIHQAESAVDALHPGAGQRAHALLILANLLRDRKGSGDAECALALLREASRVPTAPPQRRLEAAVAWGECAAGRATSGAAGWEEAADGFAETVGLLPLTAWRGLERTDRERLLASRSSLAMDAAACAIACGRLEHAVELLDQGRSVLWGQVLDTRADLTALRQAHPATAERFGRLRAALDGPAWDAAQQRRATREWEDLLGEIRALPGFGHFLLPLPFTALSEATAAGPLIIVNVSRYRCDALVVTPSGVRHVPLPGLTAGEAQTRAERYLADLDRLHRHGGRAGPGQQALLALLEWLWDTVAGPVLDSLGEPGGPGGRVWWCATGPLTLLPLHAAGYHDPDDGRPRDAVMERVVSSYMPTLRGLIRARRPVTAPDEARRLLIVGLGDPPRYAPSLAPLPGARAEAESLRLRFPHRHTIRFDADATRGQVRELLDSHTCVHFACHAEQNLADPGQGALHLYDGPFRVTDLAQLDLDGAELAVLSACQTAVGGTDLPDEAIHLAGALLLGNFRHVVSTLWEVPDDTARHVTGELYRLLDDGSGRVRTPWTAHALHEAVNSLRRLDPYDPVAWACHVHFGV